MDMPNQGIVTEKEPNGSDQFQVDHLGSKLRGKFEDWKQARQEKEEKWLEALRAFNAQFSPEQLAKMEENERLSRVFVGLTRMKVIAAYSRIIDLMFQPNQKFFGIDPTPIPETANFSAVNNKAQLEVMGLIQDGVLALNPEVDAEQIEQLIVERAEEIRSEMVIEAEEKASKMEDAIHDQLVENNADRKIKLAILEQVLLGSGCIKGPTVDVRNKRKWGKDQNGNWTSQFEEEAFPNLQHRSIFNIYPDPMATSQDDMTGLFDRHVMTRTEFKKLGRFEGFSSEKIDMIISNNPSGNYTAEDHEIERRSIAGINETHGTSDRYEVLEYWGMVSGEDLKNAGVTSIEDETVAYQANVWICGSEVIKAMLNPLEPKRIPYQIAPYELGVHSFWGVGLPEMMRDSQEVVNASVNIAIDNAALSSGPIGEINTDLLPVGENPENVKPWKMYARSGGDPSNPMVKFHNIPNNSQALIGLVDMFRKFADEETSMPSYSHGQTQAGLTKTASGMSMLMGAANVSLKSVVKNIDEYLIEPMIEGYYDWNMKWNPDESIKGDLRIDAKGSTALMSKEIQSERLLQFMQMTGNPVDMQFIERRELLKAVADSMDLDSNKFLISEEELEARSQQLQQDLQLNGQSPMGGVNQPPQQPPI